MTNTMKKNPFETLIKALHVVLKWSVRVVYVLLGLLFIALLVFLFIPKASLNFDLANLENININIMNIIYEINNAVFTGVINIKWLLVLGVFAGIVNLAFFQLIQILLRNLLKNTRETTPFISENVVLLKTMGFAFLVASVILPLVNAWLVTDVVNLLNLYQASVNLSLNLQMIFMGLIVLVLTYVFNYGAYLQEEHDSTI